MIAHILKFMGILFVLSALSASGTAFGHLVAGLIVLAGLWKISE